MSNGTHIRGILQRMRQTKRTYVHTAFEEGYICVFPTEVAARSFLVDYVLHGKHKAILAEQAISFDVFRAQFLPKHAQEQPSNTLIRQLFARTLLIHLMDFLTLSTRAFLRQTAASASILHPSCPNLGRPWMKRCSPS